MTSALPSKPNMALRLVILTGALMGGFITSVCIGDVFVAPREALELILGGTSSISTPGVADILTQIRLPRTLIATAVGAALAVSGYILQALSRNPLADPYLTGVSSGAGLAVAAAIILGLDFSLMPASAFLGGLAAAILVAQMARRAGGLSVTRLILGGVAISAVCGSLITLIITQSGGAPQAQGIIFWLAGGIAGRGWNDLGTLSIYTIGGIIATLLLSKQIRVLTLGDETAQALGVDVSRLQWVLLACAVLMCGAAVSASGLVAFVGLIAPNLARMLFVRDERVEIIASALIGAVLVTVSDLAARTLGQGQELPLGTLLSLVGGPFFLYLISTSRGEDA
ncbi:MAG TPA: iron ABC transporter permease [Candidatus Melainabacteria bacterium]|nr:iron ABC transporter permease [Candidatus Melainabacteria bacterium]HIN65292.1 iron ABC transporter permease [Candidatus Obscuribacterales bacterium]